MTASSLENIGTLQTMRAIQKENMKGKRTELNDF